MLLLAIPSVWPYGVYQFVKIVVFLTCIYNIYILKEKDQIWTILFIVLALLFNPVVPIYLSKNLWQIIDGISAIIIFTNYAKFKKIINP